MSLKKTNIYVLLNLSWIKDMLCPEENFLSKMVIFFSDGINHFESVYIKISSIILAP
ncbi:MAG: hypothetical protein Ta2E_01890 [Mycoplasmoidaceae bacterium]|nr:MAG: hypothetical protein Ta2E_01890 [Mycoplasmoidaceae bacterium]